MLRCLVGCFAFVLVFAGDASAQSRQPPQPPAAERERDAQPEQRGTADAPFFVQTVRTPEDQADSREEQRSRDTQTWLIIAQIILGLLTLGGLWFAKRSADAAKISADAAKEALNVESAPFISVKPVNGGNLRLAETGKFREIDPTENKSRDVPSVFFRIVNASRGPLVVTKIFRVWEAVEWGKSPAAHIYPNTAKDWESKETHIVLGAGAESEPLRARSERLKAPIHSDACVYFYGWVEFRSLSGEVYASGFCLLYDMRLRDVGLHLALPANADQYTYRRKVTGEAPPDLVTAVQSTPS